MNEDDQKQILRYNPRLEYKNSNFHCKTCDVRIYGHLVDSSKDAREKNNMGCVTSVHNKMVAIRLSCSVLESKGWTIWWAKGPYPSYVEHYPRLVCPSGHKVKKMHKKLVNREEIICPKCV